MKSIEIKRKNKRIQVIGYVFLAVFFISLIRAVDLQVFQSEALSRKAKEQTVRLDVERGKRGSILDARLRSFAISAEVSSIAADATKIDDPETTATRLSRILGKPESVLLTKLKSRKKFVWLKRKISPVEKNAVKEMGIRGIMFLPAEDRYYPNKTIAAQLIGFTGMDGGGLEGLEYLFDDELRGKSKEFFRTKDGLGRFFSTGNKVGEPKVSTAYDGKNLILTIDKTIQFIAENALRETVDHYSAKSGIVVIMEPITGAILAMAHYPSFNPNAFEKFSPEIWRNRAVTDQFEPGSPMKVFCAAAALESGLCAPNTIFYCENGKYQIGEDFVHDTEPHGWLTLKNIIKHSSNIGAVKISEVVGPELLYKTLRAFGFGAKTGIDCPGETPGSLAPFERWTKIDAGAVAFGHGISVSAIQLITAVGALANNGILMKPFVVKAVMDSYGRRVREFGPTPVRRVVSEETARTIKNMMQSVVEGGTGKRAAIPGYSVCGKTGTSEKIDKHGQYDEDKYIASFIGFTPAENPKISVFVVIDEPKGKHYGGIVAAPAFRKIAGETLQYLNIPPDDRKNHLRVSREAERQG